MTSESPETGWRRRRTREVRVGAIAVGGDNPIRVQSMTTTPTADVAATVAQAIRLVEAGCEIVRVTVPTRADAEALPRIREALRASGHDVPLVADIHFTPAVALLAVEHVDKVRINPGNYADKKRFAVREYGDAEYAAELERIERTFAPLVARCRDLGVAMRIGTNHGSLSDRIVNRFGDTPHGMVESALEFVRICERRDYRDLILSMKSSNPVVVLAAYRLLVERMDAEGMDYPVHLGVTEAGDGEDARVKSAIGIGVLLDEGIGDTVRVSLTEDPVAEIPVARALIAPYRTPLAGPPPAARPSATSARRTSRPVAVGPVRIGGDGPPAVEVPLASGFEDPAALRSELDALLGPATAPGARPEVVSIDVADLAGLERVAIPSVIAGRVAVSLRPSPALATSLDGPGWERLARAGHRIHLDAEGDAAALARVGRAAAACRAAGAALLIEVGDPADDAGRAADAAVRAVDAASAAGLADLLVAAAPTLAPSPLVAGRRLAACLARAGRDVPVVLVDRPDARGADPLLGPATALGGLLCDGIGDAIHVARASSSDARALSFGILQAARVRITRTEYISCPSCGRTLFDLEETTARIKARTAHLDGVKIAIMGCVVNGPGEMADADFGYVGWGEGRVALFVGRTMVERDVPTAEADERLVRLIRERGRWVDPPDGG